MPEQRPAFYSDEDFAIIRPYYAPRPEPGPIPEPGIFDDPVACVRINRSWIPHILGILDALDQIDAWQGTSEQIDAARGEIQALMIALMQPCEAEPCPDCPEPEIIIQPRGGGCAAADSSCEECEDNDMSNCPVPPIKVEAGVLYYWHCCQWVVVGEIAATTKDQVGTNTPSTPIEGFSCKKATMMATVFVDVVQTHWDMITVLPAGNYVSQMRAAFPDLNLGKTQLIAANIVAYTLKIVDALVPGDTWGSESLQWLKCRWARIVEDNETNGITQEEYSQMEEALKTVLSGPFESYVRWLFTAIGYDGFQYLAASSEQLTGEDCVCPNEAPDEMLPPAEVEYVWLHDFQFFNNNQGFSSQLGDGVYVLGYGWVGSTTHYESGSRCNIRKQTLDAKTGTVLYIAVEYTLNDKLGEFQNPISQSVLNDVQLAEYTLEQGGGRVNAQIIDVDYTTDADAWLAMDLSWADTDDGPLVIHRIVIAGIGDDPWEA